MLLRRKPKWSLVTEEGKWSYRGVPKAKYLGGVVSEEVDMTPELSSRYSKAYANLGKYNKKLYGNKLTGDNEFLKMKVHLIKQEVLEALLYG